MRHPAGTTLTRRSVTFLQVPLKAAAAKNYGTGLRAGLNPAIACLREPTHIKGAPHLLTRTALRAALDLSSLLPRSHRRLG